MSLTDTVRLRGLTGALALFALCAGASAQTTITVGPHPPLPNGEVGVAYSQSLTASETPLASPTCCTWSVTRGSLGSLNLTFSGLNNTNALISGTPGAGDAGTLSFTVTASDTLILANGKQAYSITIFPQLQITGASLPTGQPGVLYPSITLGATGGTGSYTWSLASGSPPPGLTLNPDGTIGPGTPTTVGAFPFTAQVADGITTATLGFSITIAPPPLVLQTTSLPSGEAGAPYSAPLSATGGVPPYNWSASGLPHGLGVNPSTGIISGPLAPDATTSTNVVLKVTDSTSTSTSSLPLTLTVTPGPSITSSSPLPNGEATAPYSQTLTATGGATPYTWAVTGGSLPAGLSLGAGGVLSGAPTAAALGTSSFTVKVTDSLNGTATQTMSITVIAGPTVNTASVLPNGTVGVAYTNVTLAASNGTQPYTWLISTGSLPPGLSLSGNAGAITGQPTASGTSNFTVQVTDAQGVTATKQFSITIAAGLIITTAPVLPNATIGLAYSVTISAAGGTPPYTWSATNGSLPAGVTLNSSTGTLTGTPTSSGGSPFTIQVTVTDSASVTATKEFLLTIGASLAITSGATLPQGTLGQAYPTLTLAAVGGSQPYTWSVSAGSMATALSLSSSGTIAGTPTEAGAFNFTVQVKDSSGSTATKAFTIFIIPPTLPQVNTGVPPTSPAAQQISFGVSLASIYPLDITGQITLSFQPDAIAPAADPAIQFSAGGTTAHFTIPANTRDAVFSSSSQIAFQTGTVSGAITLSFALATGGAELPGFDQTITIPRSAPVIQTVQLVRNSAGLEIHVVGFSPSRDLTEAGLTFAAAPGASLQTTKVTESLASVATAWYQSTGSAQYGSQLMLVLPFTASQGSVDAVGSVSVVLKNAQGSSPAANGTF